MRQSSLVFCSFTILSGAFVCGCRANHAAPAATQDVQSPYAPAQQPSTDARPAPAPIEIVEEQWSDGTPRSYKEVLREPDGTAVNHGRYTLWYDNGDKEYEGIYDHGQLNGLEIAWHRNGQKWTEQQYEHGVRQGYRRNWDEKGRLRGEENYENGRPHGVWTLWKDDGTVKWHCRYEHGQPVAE